MKLRFEQKVWVFSVLMGPVILFVWTVMREGNVSYDGPFGVFFMIVLIGAFSFPFLLLLKALFRRLNIPERNLTANRLLTFAFGLLAILAALLFSSFLNSDSIFDRSNMLPVVSYLVPLTFGCLFFGNRFNSVTPEVL